MPHPQDKERDLLERVLDFVADHEDVTDGDAGPLPNRAMSLATELRALLSNHPAIPDGWKLVPIEPTTAMINAGECGCMDNDVTVAVYQRMLDAAPSPEKHPPWCSGGCCNAEDAAPAQQGGDLGGTRLTEYDARTIRILLGKHHQMMITLPPNDVERLQQLLAGAAAIGGKQ